LLENNRRISITHSLLDSNKGERTMSENTENPNESPQENAMRVALCASRHPIPDVHDAIFPQVVENPLDFGAHYTHTDAWIDENADFLVVPSNKLYIYVTGLTPVLTSFLLMYETYPLEARVSLMHYNRDTKKYEEQEWA
tara:strand:- start:241 stop:660 length:420 start_codon:yes stop_codon:yes gene_type:complete